MTRPLASDVSITIKQSRWPCVLDPTLALSRYGLPLVKQLGERAELWVVREFWHMLDNSQFYQYQPERLLAHLPEHSPLSSEQQQLSQQLSRSLREWERLRLSVDPNERQVHFLADVLGESCVPTGTDSDLIWRWEALAQGLDRHLGSQLHRPPALALAYRDLAALAAARPACILTHRSAAEAVQNLPPHLCTTLEQWGIPCQQIAAENAIAAIERDYLQTLLVHAGLSKFLWTGLHLVVLHLAVPAAGTLSTDADWSDAYVLAEAADVDMPEALWESAQGCWYTL